MCPVQTTRGSEVPSDSGPEGSFAIHARQHRSEQAYSTCSSGSEEAKKPKKKKVGYAWAAAFDLG